MIKNNKGITLVELIVVLVLLIILFLFAVNRVNDQMEDTEANSVKADAISYVKAINNTFTIANGTSLFPVYEGIYTIAELKEYGVTVSGTKPDSGFIYSTNSKVLNGCLTYEKRRATIVNNEVTKVDKGKCVLPTSYAEEYPTYYIDYANSEQTFTVPKTGRYVIEAWGAQGGNATFMYRPVEGGYGGYARATMNLNKDDVLYINTGGQGESLKFYSGSVIISDNNYGYNGGGYAQDENGNSVHAGGGGATHVALSSGLLTEFQNNLESLLLVAGGGGGASSHTSYPSYSGQGGSGGGYIGGTAILGNDTCYNYGTGGTQLEPGTYVACEHDGNTSRPENPPAAGFGKGSNHAVTRINSHPNFSYSGGGAGLYGGQSGRHAPGGGGSGYIGNDLLINKVMYCYRCTESSDDDTKTVSTECVSKTATKACSKQGNGFVKITYIIGS